MRWTLLLGYLTALLVAGSAHVHDEPSAPDDGPHAVACGEARGHLHADDTRRHDDRHDDCLACKYRQQQHHLDLSPSPATPSLAWAVGLPPFRSPLSPQVVRLSGRGPPRA